MRILYFIPHLIHGGAQKQLAYLAPQLASLGHEVHVAYLLDGPNVARLQNSEVRLHKLQKRSNYDPKILFQLIRLVRRINPDLMQTCLLQADIVGGMAARLTRTPWVLRESMSTMAFAPDVKNRLKVAMARGVSAIVANSRGGERYWHLHLPHKKLFVIPNALPLAEIAQVPPARTSGPDQGGRMLLFVGRFDQQRYAGGLVHQKNIDSLVAALGQVSKPGVVGLLCGDGPRLPVIRRLVEQLDLADRVQLPGFVTNVWPLMKQADVFVSVSWFEGHPNTVLEAMACGCPVIVSDIPEHREFLDEDSALFVNPGDPGAIARAIEYTLSAPDEARRRAQVAKQKVQRWDVAVIARQHEEAYREILGYQESRTQPSAPHPASHEDRVA